jgi:MFS family permease
MISTQRGFGSKMNSAHVGGVIAAGMIGNALEWYDFAIYGYFAVQIGRHFFPHDDAVAQLLSAFGVFAIGYLMRPIGGVLVGHIGDKFGRRTALTFSVTAMAIPTFLVGLLPAYQTNSRLLGSLCCGLCRDFQWAANIQAQWCSWSSMPLKDAAA